MNLLNNAVVRRSKSWLKPKVFRASDEMIRRSIERRLPRLIAARAQQPPPSGASYAVLMPTSFGNMGDEAMGISLIQNLQARGASRITVITMAEEDRFDDLIPGLETVHAPNLMRPTGWSKALDRIEEVLSRVTHLILIGADVLDGSYSVSTSSRRLRIADFASRAGVQTTIGGFSFKANSSPVARDLLEEISSRVSLCLRDPQSYERVRSFARGPVYLAADMAFLMPPATTFGPKAQRSIDWMEAERLAGRVILVFNANPIGLGMALGARDGDGVPDLTPAVKLFSATLERLLAADDNISLLFLAHDYRKYNNDVDFLKALYEALPPAIAKRTHLAVDRLQPPEAKAICARGDFVITGRMHLGIGALGVGTPCMFLDYMGKVQGLLQHFGLSDLRFTVDDMRDPADFAASIGRKLAVREQYRASIAEALPRVKQLSSLNFDVVMGPTMDAAAG